MSVSVSKLDKLKGILTRDIRGEVPDNAIKDATDLYEQFRPWFEPKNIFMQLRASQLASNETIFAAISRLSNSMGSIPLKLMMNYEPYLNHPVSELFAVGPNPNMTTLDFIRALETCRNTDGSGYALKEYDTRYSVKALWPLDPARVKPVIEANTKELWYEVQMDKGRYYVHNMDMIHVKHIYGTLYNPVSPLEVLRGSMDFDAKVKTFSLEQVEGAVRASFILKLSTQANEQVKKQALESFKAFYRDNGGVLIEESGVTITPIERKAFIDPKVFEVEKITRARVATVFQIPVHMLGETERMPYDNREQMGIEYVQDTIIPIVTQYEQEFERKLLTPQERASGLYISFNVAGLLRGDTKTRGEFYFKGIRSGYLTPNEVRAMENLPPKEGGDSLYMSRDLQPIGKEEGRG